LKSDCFILSLPRKSEALGWDFTLAAK